MKKKVGPFIVMTYDGNKSNFSIKNFRDFRDEHYTCVDQMLIAAIEKQKKENKMDKKQIEQIVLEESIQYSKGYDFDYRDYAQNDFETGALFMLNYLIDNNILKLGGNDGIRE